VSVELAPIRVNLIAAGFVDTPLSASLLGEDLDKRRDQLGATLPVGRVIAGRHRRPRRAHHDQHGAHRRDLRHRRRPATGLKTTSWSSRR
jgi:NAD(P)-dependent dehydrogenase (short-subunit alcohol dehydrogenase family)